MSYIDVLRQHLVENPTSSQGKWKVDKRQQRGKMLLSELGSYIHIADSGSHYRAPSQYKLDDEYRAETGQARYYNVDFAAKTCSCPDNHDSRNSCKHMYAVREWLLRQMPEKLAEMWAQAVIMDMAAMETGGPVLKAYETWSVAGDVAEEAGRNFLGMQAIAQERARRFKGYSGVFLIGSRYPWLL